MGLLWTYFRDTLRAPFLAKAGPLAALVQGAAACLDTVRDVISTLRDQFLPARCEDVYLERFAASRGIVRAPLEPVEYWQARVRFAYHWWARGGRASAMTEGLTIGFGFDSAKVVNLRAEDPLRWASFRVVMEGGDGDILLRLNQIRWAINEVKPARSKLEQMKFYAPTQRVERTTGIAAMCGVVTTIFPYLPTDAVATDMLAWRAVGSLGGTITTIFPGGEE
uniref:Phage tail protein n=1 Tax=Geobacter sp. (strain M21) TaxID=443144 RepID=C6E6P4_GEOSM